MCLGVPSYAKVAGKQRPASQYIEFYAAELTVGFIAPQWLNAGNFM